MSLEQETLPTLPLPSPRIQTARLRRAPRRNRFRGIVNTVMLALTGLATLAALAPLAWILLEVVARGIQVITPAFFTQVFAPVSEGGGGVLHAIIGSVLLIAVASAVAIPIGILAGFYVADHPNTTVGLVVRFSTDVLSGLPSIVVGLFVYALTVAGRGYSGWSGGIALAIMMLPIVIRTTEEMLKLVPRSLREASLGLGASEWRTSLTILLPAARTGVVTGLMLAVARVSGETAPLLFTAQGSNVLSLDLGGPMASLPLTLYKYAVDPDATRNAQAWAIALIIVALVLALNIGARLISSRNARKA